MISIKATDFSEFGKELKERVEKSAQNALAQTCEKFEQNATSAYSVHAQRYGETTPWSVTSERIDDKTYEITGHDTLFLEYGTGIKWSFSEHPEKGEFGAGTWSDTYGKGHWNDPNGWTDDHGVHHYGCPPARAFYDERKQISTNFNSFFEEGLKK